MEDHGGYRCPLHGLVRGLPSPGVRYQRIVDGDGWRCSCGRRLRREPSPPAPPRLTRYLVAISSILWRLRAPRRAA